MANIHLKTVFLANEQSAVKMYPEHRAASSAPTTEHSEKSIISKVSQSKDVQ